MSSRDSTREPSDFLVQFLEDDAQMVVSRLRIFCDERVVIGSTYKVRWGNDESETSEAKILESGSYATLAPKVPKKKRPRKTQKKNNPAPNPQKRRKTRPRVSRKRLARVLSRGQPPHENSPSKSTSAAGTSADFSSDAMPGTCTQHSVPTVAADADLQLTNPDVPSLPESDAHEANNGTSSNTCNSPLSPTLSWCPPPTPPRRRARRIDLDAYFQAVAAPPENFLGINEEYLDLMNDDDVINPRLHVLDQPLDPLQGLSLGDYVRQRNRMLFQMLITLDKKMDNLLQLQQQVESKVTYLYERLYAQVTKK